MITLISNHHLLTKHSPFTALELSITLVSVGAVYLGYANMYTNQNLNQ